VWKWDVDAAGDGLTGLTGHAPHIPPPKVRFIHPNHTSLNILAKHPVDVLQWENSWTILRTPRPHATPIHPMAKSAVMYGISNPISHGANW
jgi:hypothetical protein